MNHRNRNAVVTVRLTRNEARALMLGPRHPSDLVTIGFKDHGAFYRAWFRGWNKLGDALTQTKKDIDEAAKKD
jgi:hypothetical protein